MIATDLNVDKLGEIASTPGISVRKLDVTDGSAITALAQDIPTPNVLVNCAGFVHHGTIARVQPEGLGLFLQSECALDVSHHSGVAATHAG